MNYTFYYYDDSAISTEHFNHSIKISISFYFRVLICFKVGHSTIWENNTSQNTSFCRVCLQWMLFFLSKPGENLYPYPV